MNWQQALDIITAVIPIVLAIAGGIAVIIFVKYRGTIDALKDAASTYETLADSYKQTNEQLRQEAADLRQEIENLKKMVEIERKALQLAMDEMMESMKRFGICIESDKCPKFKPPTGDVKIGE